MALELRTPTATNYNLFDAGDSPLKSETLIAAGQEFAELFVKAVDDYNLNNSLEYPTPELEYVTAERQMNFNMDLPYNKVGRDPVFVNYLNTYFNWVTPTTGELAGMETPLEAYDYVHGAIALGYEKMLETMAVKSLRGISTATDNRVDNVATVLALPFTTLVDSVTGEVKKVAQNIFILLDLQEGRPIA